MPVGRIALDDALTEVAFALCCQQRLEPPASVRYSSRIVAELEHALRAHAADQSLEKQLAALYLCADRIRGSNTTIRNPPGFLTAIVRGENWDLPPKLLQRARVRIEAEVNPGSDVAAQQRFEQRLGEIYQAPMTHEVGARVRDLIAAELERRDALRRPPGARP